MLFAKFGYEMVAMDLLDPLPSVDFGGHLGVEFVGIDDKSIMGSF